MRTYLVNSVYWEDAMGRAKFENQTPKPLLKVDILFKFFVQVSVFFSCFNNQNIWLKKMKLVILLLMATMEKQSTYLLIYFQNELPQNTEIFPQRIKGI